MSIEVDTAIDLSTGILCKGIQLRSMDTKEKEETIRKCAALILDRDLTVFEERKNRMFK